VCGVQSTGASALASSVGVGPQKTEQEERDLPRADEARGAVNVKNEPVNGEFLQRQAKDTPREEKGHTPILSPAVVNAHRAPLSLRNRQRPRASSEGPSTLLLLLLLLLLLAMTLGLEATAHAR
jgi:hypothetical protein